MKFKIGQLVAITDPNYEDWPEGKIEAIDESRDRPYWVKQRPYGYKRNTWAKEDMLMDWDEWAEQQTT